MATWSPNIIGQSWSRGATNIDDDLIYIIYDIDVEPAVGDTVTFSGSTFLYLTTVQSIMCSAIYDTGTGLTNYCNTLFYLSEPFNNNDGYEYTYGVSGSANGRCTVGIYRRPAGTSGAWANFSGSNGYLTRDRMYLPPVILRTPNGVCFTVLNTLHTEVSSTGSGVFNYNTETVFGNYYNTTAALNVSHVITNYDVLYGSVFYHNASPVIANEDPYGDPSTADEEGGDGGRDGTSDAIPIPSLPGLSAVQTSFLRLYAPTVAQLNSLASYMWSDGFDLETFKKLFANPMDSILGMSIIPVSVPTSGTSEIKIGNVGTGVYMSIASSQYVTVNCGSLAIPEYWGAYLDYDPYTKLELYLPYIGIHPVSADEFVGKTMSIVYNVDILSGACVAFVKSNNSVLYTFLGHCACSVPITGNNWTNMINGTLSIAGAIGSMVATGGISAPFALSSIASTAVNSAKPTIEKSGSISGAGGMLGIQKPYLVITRPRQAVPLNQNVFIGYPSYTTQIMGDLTGYTEVEEIHLENIPATGAELTEIENLLKSGVIF